MEGKRIANSVYALPKSQLKMMTDKYLETTGLNLAGLGESSNCSSSEDISECDPLNCQHLTKKIEYIPKVNWREKVRLYKEELAYSQNRKSTPSHIP